MPRKKKTIVVAPASGKPVDLANMDVATMMTEYHVPKGIFDTISSIVPDFIKDGLKKFVIGVPTLDTEKQVMKIKITITGEGENPDTIVKLQVSMVPTVAHKIKVSTDGGETWKELSYMSTTDEDGNDEIVAPNPNKKGRPKKKED
jgi:hypothetical protein